RYTSPDGPTASDVRQHGHACSATTTLGPNERPPSSDRATRICELGSSSAPCPPCPPWCAASAACARAPLPPALAAAASAAARARPSIHETSTVPSGSTATS